MTDAVARLVNLIAETLGTYEFIVLGFMAVVLVSLICGSVGALVVGNRMAFFSDALAHCAFAGVALGIIVTLTLGGREGELDWVIPVVMIVFGTIVGMGINYVRQRTSLSSDTVIGVFFAGAMGFGGILFGALGPIANISPEAFLFGSINYVRERDVIWLVVIGAATFIFLWLYYNQLVFATFNPSLARSRRIPLQTLDYVFIILLAMIVNICLRAVGALLINAMLVVPAAAAAVLSRNLRQMFWWTITISLLAGLGGAFISMFVQFRVRGAVIEIGPGGAIVTLCVLAFAISTLIGPMLRQRSA